MTNTHRNILIVLGILFVPRLLRARNGGSVRFVSFEKSYQRTAVWEGGYQKNPNDPGNYNSNGQLVGTNMGITPNILQPYFGRVPSENDMRNLSPQLAKKIYRERFWDKIKGDRHQHQYLVDILFDGVVNHGRGVRLLQEVLGISQDNIYGTNTHNAVLNSNPCQLYNAYKNRRKKYYDELIAQTPSLAIFRNGWMNRINSFNDC